MTLNKLLGFFFCSSLLVAVGQTEPQYTQYMYNMGSFNPGYSGSVEDFDILALYRAQWLDIPDAPKTLRLGTNYPLKAKNIGLGFNLVSDQLGPTSQTYVNANYSYRINLNSEVALAFGVTGGVANLSVNLSEGTFQSPSDQLLQEGTFTRFYPTLGFGAFLYQEDWYLGISTPNFILNTTYSDDLKSIIDERLQVNFVGGYVFELSNALKFKPAFLLNTVQGAPATFNLSANFLLADALTAGVSYRSANSFNVMAGIQLSSAIFIGYAYDSNINGLSGFSGSGHEIFVKYYVGKSGGFLFDGLKMGGGSKDKPKRIDTPRFF